MTVQEENGGLPNFEEPVEEVATEEPVEEVATEEPIEEDVTEEPVEEDVTEEPAEDGAVNPILLERAKALGFEQEDLDAWGDNAESILDRLDEKYIKDYVSQQKDQREADSGAEETDDGGAKQPSEAVEADALKILEEAGYDKDDPTYKAMETSLKAQNDQFSQLQETINFLLNKQEVERIEGELSSYFRELPDDRKALLGGKNFAEAGQDPRYADVVMELRETMGDVHNAIVQRGQNPTTKQVADRAFEIVFADKLSAMRQDRRQQALQKRSQSKVTKPASRDKPVLDKTKEEIALELQRSLNQYSA